MASDGSSSGRAEPEMEGAPRARRIPRRERDNADNGQAGSDDDQEAGEFQPYRRRNAVESEDSSLYEPDSEEGEEEGSRDGKQSEQAPPPPAEEIKAEVDSDDGLSLTAHSRASSPRMTPRKRPSHPTPSDNRPFKRAKGPFNAAYLQLLNADIEDAADQLVPPGPDEPELQPSQVGLVLWTTTEKAVLFEALGRLGADDVPGIARRIRTKSAFEIAQYLKLVQEETRTRASGEERPDRHTVGPAHMSAATELSPACCTALEAAADAVALRQEGFEEGRERRKWGGQYWLITPLNYRNLEQEAAEGAGVDAGAGEEDDEDEERGNTVARLRPVVELFRLREWLMLPARVFMNASFPEGNWQSVADADELPAIRATALQDLYSLAVSATRRLVAAAIFVAESRTRAKRVPRSGPSARLTRRDVEAAVLSLGFQRNSDDFWARCARRLRLDVYDYDNWQGGGGEEQEPMSYDDVERALGITDPTHREDDDLDEGGFAAVENEAFLSSGKDAPQEQGEEDGGDEEGTSSASDATGLQKSKVEDTDDEEIQQEANELLLHSALPYAFTTRTRRSLKARIKAAREQEAYADVLDARAAYREERRLWALLGKAPPESLVKLGTPDPPPRGTTRRALDDVYPIGRDWRQKVQYVSEWTVGLPRGAVDEASG